MLRSIDFLLLVCASSIFWFTVAILASSSLMTGLFWTASCWSLAIQSGVTSRQDNGENIATQISSVIRNRNRSSIFGGAANGLFGVSLSTEGNGGGGGGMGGGGRGGCPGTDTGGGGVASVGVFPVAGGGIGLGGDDDGTGAGIARLRESIAGVVGVGVVDVITDVRAVGFVC